MEEKTQTHLLLDRLVRLYWPRWMHDLYRLNDPWKVDPVGYREPGHRDIGYDPARVACFLEMLTRGQEPEPIDVNCDWEPCVPDGQHRFVAHVIYGSRKIPANFSGPSNFRSWLGGETDEWPW